MKIKIKKLNENAKLPTYAHQGDAGMDLYASDDVIMNPGEVVSVPTGLAFEIPEGFVGLIWDKSGLSLKQGLKTMGGVIDSGYRGETKVVITNLGKQPYHIKKHTKIAQMLIQPVSSAEIVEAEELSDSSRATGGFGSSGLH
ncbi:MAG: dUTP diphosphatase [Nanoarchaeota archaeon]